MLYSSAAPFFDRSVRQSLQFLVEAREFQDSSTDFEKLTKIVETFIRPSSPFEVNISWTTRSAILSMADAERFAELTPVSVTSCLTLTHLPRVCAVLLSFFVVLRVNLRCDNAVEHCRQWFRLLLRQLPFLQNPTLSALLADLPQKKEDMWQSYFKFCQ